MESLLASRKRSFAELSDGEHHIPSRPSVKELKQQHSNGYQAAIATPTDPANATKPATASRPPSPSAKASFDSDASILLIGIRGVGKSSLGFLAATAYSRQLIESDRAFLEATGATRTAYRKAHTTSDYHHKHCEVLRQLLHVRSRNCVIVCSFADLEGEGAHIVQKFAQRHPVIYIARDVLGIQEYVRVWPEDRIQDLIRASEALLRECSNFEYFNLTESQETCSLTPSDTVTGTPSRTLSGPFLTLKRTERDFLKLLRNIVGDHDRGRSHQSAYPLSQLSVDRLEFTSAVVMEADEVICTGHDLEDAQIGVDAIQLVVNTKSAKDGSRRSNKHECFNLASEAFAIVRRSTILPIIIVVSPGDRFDHEEHMTSIELLEYCLRLGPEYCTLDMRLERPRLERLLARRGRTKFIGQYGASERPSDGWGAQLWMDLYRRADDLGCNIVKLTMPAESLDDNFMTQSLQHRLRSLSGGRGPRLIAYCTGRRGQTSMCFNNILTPVVPVKPQLDDRCPVPTAKERNEALFASFVHEPLRFFIYGANVSFSLSPAMHNAAYSACGMPHSYRTHSASTMDDFEALVREVDFGGAAIVQPFKRTALSMMDILSPHAKAIGAVNTCIPLREDMNEAGHTEAGIFHERNRTGPVKSLYGDNTDWIGIRACIRRGLSPANTVRPSSTGLVCGAGGMARAAIYAMLSLGVQNVLVCNRTKDRAEELAEHYNDLIRTGAVAELKATNAINTRVTALDSFTNPWPEHVRHPTMIVSCIPTQTTDGTSTNFMLPHDWLSSRTGGVVVELAYMPIVTPLVRQMQNEAHKGWILLNGLDMLPEQAFAQFELFTGRRAPRKLMRGEVLRHYNEDEFPPHGALNLDSPQHS